MCQTTSIEMCSKFILERIILKKYHHYAFKLSACGETVTHTSYLLG